MRFLREFKENNTSYISAKLREIKDACNNFQGDFYLTYQVDDTGFKVELDAGIDSLFSWFFDFEDDMFYLYHSKDEFQSSVDEALDIIEKDIYMHIGLHERMSHLRTFEKFIPPSEKVVNKMEELVNRLLSEHGGGRKFFDALDDEIKDALNEDIIRELTKGCGDKWLVSTGGFGDKLHSLYENGHIDCKGVLVFNGKILTKDKGVTYYYPSKFDITGKEYVFVDDSLFSGKTFRVIEDYLKDHGSIIEYASVIYDGSKQKDPNIHSFYRYYDNH